MRRDDVRDNLLTGVTPDYYPRGCRGDDEES